MGANHKPVQLTNQFRGQSLNQTIIDVPEPEFQSGKSKAIVI